VRCVCEECLFSRSPWSSPSRGQPACATRAAYPDPPPLPVVTHRKIQLQTYNPQPDSAAITVCPFFSLATRQRETYTLLGASFHLKESDRSAVALVGRSGAVGSGRSAIKDGGRTCVYKRSTIQIAAESILPTV
jgi:hypothetical protein